jgi:alpha-amylase
LRLRSPFIPRRTRALTPRRRRARRQIREGVLASLRLGAGHSGQPLIYGISAALEVAALKAKRKARGADEPSPAPGGEVRPLRTCACRAHARRACALARQQGQRAAETSFVTTGAPFLTSNPPQAKPDARASAMGLADAEALELAAAEMAVAASALVAAEKDMAAAAALALAASPEALADAEAALEPLERSRAEAAASLERRMAAMEAAIASRRSPKESVAEKLRAQRQREMMEGLGMRAPEGGGAAAASGTGPGAGNGYEVILQGFNWDAHGVKPSWYARLAAAADSIAAAGFSTVWLPPATNSVSAQGYLPRDLYDLNSSYGDEGALRQLLRSLKGSGLKSVADIVINHRCAHSQKNGKWNQFGGRLAWDESAICRGNEQFGGTGAPSTGEPYSAAPNIDHSNQKVRASLSEWLCHMRAVGFDGWRFDYVKGYSGEFTRKYIDASVPALAFGEYWDACNYTGGVLDYNQDAHRQRIVNWCDKTGGTAAAFDFTTKGILQEAVGRGEYWRLVDSAGRMPGFAGLWATRAITFIENHDTGPPLAHWPFPQAELAQGYAYLLTHPGTPCVFWDHWEGSKHPGLRETINQLLAVRRGAKLSARSTVVVLKAAAEVYAACIDGKVVVKIGWGDFSPNALKLEGRHWDRACNGRNFAVWKAGEAL